MTDTPQKNWIDAMIERESTPKPARKETVAEFAKKWGIDDSTYWYQSRKPENRARVVDIWLSEAMKGGNEVLKKLRENALEGKEKSIEMYLKFVLELKDRMDITTDGKELPQPIIPLHEK
jgi:hypothetical protein